jgi:hypothetical protein
MKKEEGTYTMDAVCLNCGHTWSAYVPKGMPVVVYEKGIACDECKCGTVEIRKQMRFR